MASQEDDASLDNKRPSGTTPGKGAIPAVSFEELARGDNEVIIEFQNQQYRLRVTKNGKLILNK